MNYFPLCSLSVLTKALKIFRRRYIINDQMHTESDTINSLKNIKGEKIKKKLFGFGRLWGRICSENAILREGVFLLLFVLIRR